MFFWFIVVFFSTKIKSLHLFGLDQVAVGSRSVLLFVSHAYSCALLLLNRLQFDAEAPSH